MTQEQQKSNLAIITLILGLVSFIPLFGIILGILAIILGILSLNKIKKEKLSGKKTTIIGMILGILGISFTFIIYGSLFYYWFISKTGPFTEIKAKASEQILTQTAGSLELYKKQNWTYPESLKEASDAGFSILTFDHYLKPFFYKVTNDGQDYELRSLGADWEYGTTDDIFPLGQNNIISNQDEQYCDYELDWDSCNNKTIKISGTNPRYTGTINQQPWIDSQIETSEEYQSSLDTEGKRHVILISSEEIDCKNKMTVIGTLETNVWPCDSETWWKSSYCGSSITVKEWKCE